jgi:adenylate cyclase
LVVVELKIARLLNELMRRKVVRVAIGYAVVMWIFLQIAEVTFEPLRLPDWALTLVVVLAIIGFAVAVVLAWALEVTPEGIRRDPQDSPDEGSSANASSSGVLHSVAVLPFADMSPDRDQGSFCDGIAEEILNALSKIHCLSVPSRTASFRFDIENLDVHEIGRALNVETILEGSVRMDGDRLRITVQLISVRSGYHIWAKAYDRKAVDVFDVQEEIAQDILCHLCGAMNLEDWFMSMEASGETFGAYDYCAQGLHYLKLRSGPSLGFAIDMLSKAVALQPAMSLAWAGLAEAHTCIYLYQEGRHEHRDLAMEAAAKAIALEYDAPASRCAMGMALMIAGRYADAAVEFRTALALNPRLFSASYYYARCCQLQGKLEQAARLYESAIRMRPHDYQAPLLVVALYRRLGMHDKACAAARRGTQLAERHLMLYPDDVRALYLGCLGFLHLGEVDKGREWATRALALHPDDVLAHYNVACFYAQAGDIDHAIEQLSKAAISGTEFTDWINNDPDLDPIRDDQRFKVIREAA